jgi:hypothetical protein
VAAAAKSVRTEKRREREMIGTTSPPPVNLPLEQRRIRRQSALAALLCAAVLAAAMLWLPGVVDFPDEPANRIAFGLRADALLLIPLMVGVRWVSSTRYRSAEDNVGSAYAPPSAKLAVALAYLQNTLEQTVITAFALTALATIEGDAPLAYICASVPLFALGRLTFARGYLKGAGGRAFGMAATALPSLGAIVWLVADMGARLLTGF